jgi:hypothetical protein
LTRAREALDRKGRAFLNEFVRYSANVSLKDKESLGIFETKPSPVPQPASEPVAELTFPALHLVKLAHEFPFSVIFCPPGNFPILQRF